MCTAGVPRSMPEVAITCPRLTEAPRVTWYPCRKETETLNPAAGSMVTDLIPATDPAKVTVPEAGARTSVPTGTAKSIP